MKLSKRVVVLVFGCVFAQLNRAECFAAGESPEELLRRARTEVLAAAKELSDAKIEVTDRANRAVLSELKKTDKALQLAADGFREHDARAPIGLDRASSALIELDTIVAVQEKNAKRLSPRLVAVSRIIDSLVEVYSLGLFRAEQRPELHLFERDLANRIVESLQEIRQLIFNLGGSLGEGQLLEPILGHLVEQGNRLPMVITDASSYVAATGLARRYLARINGASFYLEPRNMAAWGLLRRPVRRLQAALGTATQFPGNFDWSRLSTPLKKGPKLDRAPLLGDQQTIETWLHNFEIISGDEAAGFIASGKNFAAPEKTPEAGANDADDDDEASADEGDKDGDAEEDAEE